MSHKNEIWIGHKIIIFHSFSKGASYFKVSNQSFSIKLNSVKVSRIMQTYFKTNTHQWGRGNRDQATTQVLHCNLNE